MMSREVADIHLPSEANATAVAHAVAQDLARQNCIAKENGSQFLDDVRTRRFTWYRIK
jgi:hypothetical protein